MADAAQAIREYQKKFDYLVAIDSDGCAFDSMELKHKECFIPNIINYYDLQAVSKYTRAAAEFVNLYSKWRGVNRFPALTLTLDLLEGWGDVQKRGVKIPKAAGLRKWIDAETKLSNPSLANAVSISGGDPDLVLALEWSQAVNESIANMVRGVPPFPYVRESLEKLAPFADAIVCSATPSEALTREWEEHDIQKFTRVICGQEVGNKKEILAMAMEGRYEPNHILMVGDAPGDMKAAKLNGCLFFPINPNHEDESWKRFYDEAFDRFMAGTYAGEYEEALIREFDSYLPENPPWK